jgi:hypothetical protein
MTIQFTVYNDTTGEIVRTGTAMTEASARAQAGPGTRVTLVGSDPVVDKVTITPIGTDGSKTARTPMTVGAAQIAANKTTMTANGVDAVTISNIPNGATYTVDVPKDQGITPIVGGTISDGILSVTTTVAGLYVVTIKNGTNLDFTVNINAA